MKKIRFNCKSLSEIPVRELEDQGNLVKIYHKQGDPKNVLRIKTKLAGLEVEVYPSKGLSIGESMIDRQPIFWDPIIEMPDPDQLDLWSDEISVNGKPSRGFTFLKTFNGGIELYGLDNWGMPTERNGKLELLHGITSNIPVHVVDVSIDQNTLVIRGSFVYRSYDNEAGDHQFWYQRGTALINVTREIKLSIENTPTIWVSDTFENVSQGDFFVDWGYHITFMPEIGAKLFIPSKHHEDRFKGALPDDIESWYPAKEERSRHEVGVIHQGLEVVDFDGLRLNYASLSRPTLADLKVHFTPSPYMQSWMCSGGAYSEEFKYAKTGEPLYKKNWDGIGIEIGASALDHNGNTDPEVPPSKPIKMGESVTNHIVVECI